MGESTLPTPASSASASAATPQETPDKTPQNKRRQRVLFIDDDEEVHALLRTYFIEHRVEFDYDLISCAGGALSMLNAYCYDGAVLDYKLPDFIGASVAAEIRKSYPDLPLAYMTNYTADEVVDEAARHRVHLWPPKIQLMNDPAHLLRLVTVLIAERPCETQTARPPAGQPERRVKGSSGNLSLRRRATDHKFAQVSDALQATILTPLVRRASFER